MSSAIMITMLGRAKAPPGASELARAHQIVGMAAAFKRIADTIHAPSHLAPDSRCLRPANWGVRRRWGGGCVCGLVRNVERCTGRLPTASGLPAVLGNREFRHCWKDPPWNEPSPHEENGRFRAGALAMREAAAMGSSASKVVRRRGPFKRTGSGRSHPAITLRRGRQCPAMHGPVAATPLEISDYKEHCQRTSPCRPTSADISTSAVTSPRPCGFGRPGRRTTGDAAATCIPAV